jgi:hypothetical protein
MMQIKILMKIPAQILNHFLWLSVGDPDYSEGFHLQQEERRKKR